MAPYHRVRHYIEAPYNGPNKVIERHPKHFIITLQDDTQLAVSSDRLKLALLLTTPPPTKQKSPQSSSSPLNKDTPSLSRILPYRAQVGKCFSTKRKITTNIDSVTWVWSLKCGHHNIFATLCFILICRQLCIRTQVGYNKPYLKLAQPGR